MASELTVQTLKGPTSGANANKILIADGHTIEGVGGLLQMVQSSTSTEVSSVSTSYVDTGLSGSITPKSASSKIYIIASFAVDIASNSILNLDIRRNGTSIRTESYFPYMSTGTGNYLFTRETLFELDSPATTSQVDYTFYFKHAVAVSSSTYFQYDTATQESLSTLTLMEIAQ